MSASKKDQLLKSLTRKEAQKPPMDVTYENKRVVLEQIMNNERQPSADADVQNSKNANEQKFADANEQESKGADVQEFVLAKEQISASTETQSVADTNAQNSKIANQQESADAKQQNSKSAEKQTSKKMRRITFHIPEELFKQLKLISVEEDLTMLEIGAQMAAEYIERKRHNGN